jgi:cytochrome c-type biogenesis protein CcmE
VKRKHRRLLAVAVGMAGLGLAAVLVLSAFQENIVFFYSPSDLVEKPVPEDRDIRIGGLVEEGSFERQTNGTVTFRLTDQANTVPVSFRGILPDLFREGQGVVAEGRVVAGGGFQAKSVLAKHDENYMPPEVADALKKSGVWRHADVENTGQAESETR